jgi:hypothetical protein
VNVRVTDRVESSRLVETNLRFDFLYTYPPHLDYALAFEIHPVFWNIVRLGRGTVQTCGEHDYDASVTSLTAPILSETYTTRIRMSR